MELRHLRYFVAVAEMENVSRAALKLHVSQPALSRQIRDLEDELGFGLLERTAKSVRLTGAGRSFLEDARALLRNADDAVSRARAVAGVATELHIGYSPTPTAEILPKILRAFQQAMPSVHVRTHDWSNNDILNGVRDGRLQLGLFVAPVKAGAMHDLRVQELFPQRICVAVSSQHPFAQRRAIPINQIAVEPLIGLTREDYSNYYDFLSDVFSKVKLKPRIVEEHDSFSGIVSAVEAGTGVAVGIDAIAHTFGNRIKLLHITPEPKPISVVIVGLKGNLCPPAEKFWECAKVAASAKGILPSQQLRDHEFKNGTKLRFAMTGRRRGKRAAIPPSRTMMKSIPA